MQKLEELIAALEAENEKLREALKQIVSINQVREFTGNDKSDGYGDGGWIIYDGQYAKIARSALSSTAIPGGDTARAPLSGPDSAGIIGDKTR
jgi:hypothetical protein